MGAVESSAPRARLCRQSGRAWRGGNPVLLFFPQKPIRADLFGEEATGSGRRDGEEMFFGERRGDSLHPFVFRYW
jgi:hypothetical protein